MGKRVDRCATRRARVDACSTPALSSATPRLWTVSPLRPEGEGLVNSMMVVFLDVVMIASMLGIAVIPRFDRRARLTPARGEAAHADPVSTSRSA